MEKSTKKGKFIILTFFFFLNTLKVYLAKLSTEKKSRNPKRQEIIEEQMVAVKRISHVKSSAAVLNMEALLRLEVNLLRSLSHPNIVSYLGLHYSRSSRRYNIILEYVDGGSVAEKIKMEGFFNFIFLGFV